jgi:hypothetical protein
MQLVIKDLSTNRLQGLFGTSLTLDVAPEETVAQVKERILEAMGIPVEEQVCTAFARRGSGFDPSRVGLKDVG